MLRPGRLLAPSPTGTFVDTLLRTDFSVRKYPSYAGAWPLPRPDFHRLENACLWARGKTKEAQQLTPRFFFVLSNNSITPNSSANCTIPAHFRLGSAAPEERTVRFPGPGAALPHLQRLRRPWPSHRFGRHP